MLRDKIIQTAHEAGFGAVGFAEAREAPHAPAFLRWLDEGCHAGMAWLAREPHRRLDPRHHLRDAQTVIALAMPVPPKTGASQHIATFAQGRDYHRWIPKRLKPLCRLLADAGGEQKIFVDSGALLERDFAHLAGLGWRGKNGLLVNERLGARFHLAIIATTLALPADTLVSSRCGECTLCINACPTRALANPHGVDARRCLSYWTIEYKGSLPPWVRPLLGEKIFGCDTCADVCPWNPTDPAKIAEEWTPRPAAQLPLRDYLAWSEEDFLKAFEGSPVRRAGYESFLRNVATALGNIGCLEDRAALEQAALHENSIIAEHARFAVAELKFRHHS